MAGGNWDMPEILKDSIASLDFLIAAREQILAQGQGRHRLEKAAPRDRGFGKEAEPSPGGGRARSLAEYQSRVQALYAGKRSLISWPRLVLTFYRKYPDGRRYLREGYPDPSPGTEALYARLG